MTDPVLTKTFWNQILSRIDKGATPFEKFSQNQLYELVLAKNNNLLPRFGIAKFAIKVLTPAFSVKLTSAIKSYDRKEGRRALKNVTPLEFSMLYHNLTFENLTYRNHLCKVYGKCHRRLIRPHCAEHNAG